MVELRIHGPPGTGKTTSLAGFVGDAAQQWGSDGVLVLSHTKAAAHEVASRRVPIGPDRVGTIHSMCFRMLGRPPIAETKLDEWRQARPDLAVSSSTSGADESSSDDPWIDQQIGDGDRLYRAMSALRAARAPRSAWPEDVAQFDAAWCAWKGTSGCLDFTDLVEVALESCPTAPGNPQVMFVDEAQDLDPLQFALVRAWAQNAQHLMLAGDADQTLYTFKGASPHEFLDKSIECQNFVLPQSHRVPRSIHELAVRWIERCSFRYPSEYRPRAEEGSMGLEPFTIADGQAIASRVLEMERTGTVMILSPCSYQLASTIVSLRACGVPFWNPYRRKNGRWNPMRGGCERLAAFAAPAAAGVPWTWKQLATWAELVKADGTFVRGAKARIDRALEEGAGPDSTEEESELFPWETKERAPEAPDESVLRALLEPEAYAQLRSDAVRADPILWIVPRVLSSKRSAVDYALTVWRSRGLRGLSDKPNVIVGTVHSVKGGEADSVILSPDISMAGLREWLETGEQRDSVLRLFYVGVTRARRHLSMLRRSGVASVDVEAFLKRGR